MTAVSRRGGMVRDGVVRGWGPGLLTGAASGSAGESVIRVIIWGGARGRGGRPAQRLVGGLAA